MIEKARLFQIAADPAKQNVLFKDTLEKQKTTGCSKMQWQLSAR